MLVDVVRVLAMKMSLVHQMIEQFWQTNSTGNAEGRSYDRPLRISFVRSARSSCDPRSTLEAMI